jgi:hypothetical protein
MQMKQFNEKGIEESRNLLLETLQERLDKYPWDFKRFLSGYSTSLLLNFNENALVSMLDTFLELLKQNPDTNPEDVQEVLYLTNHKVLPILNNQLVGNKSKCLAVKERMQENYQSIFENLDELKEFYESQNLEGFSQECFDITSTLNSLGESVLTVNSKQNRSLD